MVLVLLLGDMHIPHRAADLPPQFKELLKPGKIHSILCAGNLCSKTLMEYLKSITPDVTLVQGDFDEFTSRELAVHAVGDFKLGLIHGHQVIPWGDQGGLSLLHRQLGVDVLVTGHVHEHKTENGLQITLGSAIGKGTSMCFDPFFTKAPESKKPVILKTENGLQITLGSATGAYSSMQQSVTPSFVLLDIDGSKITAYTYHLVAGKIKIDRMEYVKPSRVEV